MENTSVISYLLSSRQSAGPVITAALRCLRDGDEGNDLHILRKTERYGGRRLPCGASSMCGKTPLLAHDHKRPESSFWRGEDAGCGRDVRVIDRHDVLVRAFRHSIAISSQGPMY